VLTAPALLALTMLAAASQLFVSTLCRSTKEANTYVSILVFVVMGIAMGIAFTPGAPRWTSFLPLVGQQRLLTAAFSGDGPSVLTLGRMAVLSAMVALATGGAVLLALHAAARQFARDDAAYGG
jgi:sodium transport system permease protein